MPDFFLDALKDTALTVPLLAAIYSLIGLIELRYIGRLGTMLRNSQKLGPVIGAMLGCIPQCGFSVIGSAIYAQRLISTGTLLAIYLSTSDEAIPILLAHPEKAASVLPLIAIKVSIAVTAGYTVDLALRKRKADDWKNTGAATAGSGLNAPAHGYIGCCRHKVANRESRIEILLFHLLRHTLKVVLLLFTFTLALNWTLDIIGTERFRVLFQAGTVLQPVLAALIGLVPNCLASIFIAELFLKGVIGMGSTVAGLCAGAGVGLLVLAQENRNAKDVGLIIGLLLFVGILAGLFIQTVWY